MEEEFIEPVPEEKAFSNVKSDFGMFKFDKSNELNETMSIQNSPMDEFDAQVLRGGE